MGASATCPQSVDGATPGERNEPSYRRSAAHVIPRHFSPDFEIDLLEQFSRFLAAAKDAQRQAVQERARLVIEMTKGLVVSLDHTGH